ncbi:MAG: DUF2208 family protein [Candidatus Bathyarchaeota archaeon]
MMPLEDVFKYLKNMYLSIIMMLLITYGMASKSTWIQPTYIIILMMALQFGVQIVKSARSKGIVEANIKDAVRAKKAASLFQASENDVNKAKQNSKGPKERSMGSKTMIVLLAPLGIFIGSGYILNMPGVIPGIEQWQSYMIGFVLSMVVSTTLTFKMKFLPGTMAITPNAYTINEKGIAFDHMSQSFIVRFPLTKLNVQRDNNFIEAECKAETSTIPNKLKLFSEKIEQLEKILTKRVETQESRDNIQTKN